MKGIDLEEETGSYRLAVSPDVPDDGLTPEGRPRALRFKKVGRTRDVIDKPNLDELRQEISLDEHRLPLEILLGQLQTDPELGLTPEQATEILLREGPNILTSTKTSPDWIRLLKCLFGGMSLLLWIGGFFCILAFFMKINIHAGSLINNFIIGIFLIATVLLTGIISYYTEAKNTKIIESFKNSSSQSATVIRNGQKYSISMEEVVIGDLVEVRAGDKIPADLRIVSSQGCKVDNSNLLGESEPQIKTYETTSEDPFETQNLAFYSTQCVEGVARGIVIYTGDRTIMGRISALSFDLELKETPIVKEIDKFLLQITAISVCIGAVMFIFAFIMRHLWMDALLLFIGFVAANVPEGFLIIVTVSLTLTAKKMASKNCLVKQLEAIETLGSTSIICADKTGTLTQNRMTVAHMFFDNEIMEADTTEDQSGTQFDKKSNGWKLLSRCAILCSKAEFKANQEFIPILKRETIGDSSETAILKFMELAVNDVSSYRLRHPKVCEIPFNPRDQLYVTVHEIEGMGRGDHIVCMKGAPEKILERCLTINIMGRETHLIQKWKDVIMDVITKLGNEGERLLGFCELLLPRGKYPIGYPFDPEKLNFPTRDLQFIGLISMIDPPRAAAPDAISRCRNAGVRVIMMTGDHPSTAKAIARSVGIMSPKNETVEDIAYRQGVRIEEVDSRLAKAIVVEGNQMKTMTNQEIESVIQSYDEIVFARASSQQKLAIVESCQRLGHVVAVAGDGVNDSPALKKADVGIAMGISGSDTTKQAADIILLDDNFTSIVAAIEEGRLIHDNLKKSISYALTSNMTAIASFIVFLLLEIPLPMGIIAVLCVALLSDIVPAIALAFEKPESSLMKKKPRNPKVDKLINSKLVLHSYLQIGSIQAVASFFIYFVIMYQNGWWFKDLVGKRRYWDAPSVNDLQDSYNQDWVSTHEVMKPNNY